MYRTVLKSFAILLASSSVSLAEVKPGTFVCKSTEAVGFARGDDGVSWVPQTTDRWKPVSFILSLEKDPDTDAGNEQNLLDFSKFKKLDAYRITITNKGPTTAMECQDTLLPDAKKGVNRFTFYSGTNPEFGCKVDQHYQISLATMRFTTTATVGYIWGDDLKTNGPVTYIGECTAF